eukprot:TRINITY_DN13522_c0_g1_i2.p1 TRINITY_DN13522_c0_g1~~TRINITY_DN13522_c0_g1_i2.p1  ORF type:complete len:562 (+),score=89.18 TRINITY_DN13522_c0_g1_i2:201-1886(+)
MSRLLALSVLTLLSLCDASTPGKGKKNVLFIVSDDFRPSLGAYGVEEARTPHLDKLAGEGVLFTSAHVQFAYCLPSRNSFMSGRRPDATKVWNFNNNFREPGVGDKWTALPEHFKNNGYLVTGAGKLFHPGSPPNFDQPRSWSAISPQGEKWPYIDGAHANASTECNITGLPFHSKHFCLTTPATESRESGKRTYLEDEAVTNLVMDRLTEAIDNWKDTGQPFFVGMGTHRPHTYWTFPKPFFDDIPADVPEAKHLQWPADVHSIGFHECAEVSHNYFDTTGAGTGFSADSFDGHQALMRRAYYGCISYVDDLIGQALGLLERSGAADDTVVTWIGDHGWHVGENDMWCKMSTLETATRIPMIIRAPWLKTANVSSAALVEAVDLYPTLSELAGLELPTGEAGEYLGGVSLVPVLKDPTATVKDATLSQMPRCWQNNTHFQQTKTSDKPGDENNRTNSWETMSDCHWTDRNYLDFMGYKLRTANMSVTKWYRWNGELLRPHFDQVIATELYSHVGDTGMGNAAFDDFENINLANDPEYAPLLQTLVTRMETEIKKWFTPNP